MSTVEHYASSGQMLADRDAGPNPKSMATLLDTTSSLIGQAEALLGVCRALLEQTRMQTTVGVRENSVEDMVEQTAWLAKRAGTKAVTALVQSNHVLRGSRQSLDIDVDMIELIRSKVPNLGRGSALVLATLVANAGRIVNNTEIRAVLRTNSRSTVKVHISRVRSALAQKSFDAKILTAPDGYGLSKEAIGKLLDCLGLNPSERQTLLAATMPDQGKDSDVAL